MNISKGMANAMKKLPNSELKCYVCGFDIPKYKGRYPVHCPACGSVLQPKVKELSDLLNATECSKKK